MNKYDDIINLEHYTSKKRPRMSIDNRAAQFAPFAALTGYSDAVKETARLTETKKRLTEEQKIILNEKITAINNNLEQQIKIIYYIQDDKKTGGKYEEYIGKIIKIDTYNNHIIISNNKKILFDNIYEIEFYD